MINLLLALSIVAYQYTHDIMYADIATAIAAFIAVIFYNLCFTLLVGLQQSTIDATEESTFNNFLTTVLISVVSYTLVPVYPLVAYALIPMIVINICICTFSVLIMLDIIAIEEGQEDEDDDY